MTDPDVLFHYTSAVGLIGIVQDEVLWATDAEFLSDAQELRFGREDLRRALLERADELCPPGSDEGSSDGSRATVMRSAADHLKPGGPFLRKQEHVVYVACFCEDGDLLSQWRGYGSPGGYAIGFRAASLREIRPLDLGDSGEIAATALPLPVRLVQVRYGPPAAERMIQQVLRDIAPKPVGSPGVGGWVRAQSLVLPALAKIKHEAFSEEKEWRLMVVGSRGFEEVSFRSGNLGAIPYVKLTIPVSAVVKVVVGPGREQLVRLRGVERLLSEHSLDHTAIQPSKAPFRG